MRGVSRKHCCTPRLAPSLPMVAGELSPERVVSAVELSWAFTIGILGSSPRGWMVSYSGEETCLSFVSCRVTYQSERAKSQSYGNGRGASVTAGTGPAVSTGGGRARRGGAGVD